MVGPVGVERHQPVLFAHQPVHGVERIGGARRRRDREVAQRPVDAGERALAQVHLRRQPLDCPPHDAGRIARLDFAARDDHQTLERRAVMRECGDGVAVRVLGLAQCAVEVDVDAPVQHILAVEAVRRQPQVLDRHAGRRRIAMGDLVRNPDPHGARPLR